MGTNYYLHLGKRSSIGNGRCSFTWAVSPPGSGEGLEPTIPIQDEYGRELTVGEFLDLIKDDEIIVDHIGERFS